MDGTTARRLAALETELVYQHAFNMVLGHGLLNLWRKELARNPEATREEILTMIDRIKTTELIFPLPKKADAAQSDLLSAEFAEHFEAFFRKVLGT